MSVMRSRRYTSFCDWVQALCGARGVPVPGELREPVAGLELPLLPPQPVFRDLVRAYEQTLHGAGKRKGMGMYYTPPELMDCLLDTALVPCLERCLAEVEPVAELMRLRLLDPSCGAGDFLLAGARRVAGAVARARGETGPQAEREILHAFVREGIYGVDQDPVAVELSRVNVYLESGVWLAAHLACGNALLGIMREEELNIPDAAYEALPGDDAEVARLLGRRNRSCRDNAGAREENGRVVTRGHACGHGGRGCREEIGAGDAIRRLREAADVALAPFLLMKQEGVPVPLTSHVRKCLEGDLPPEAPELIAAGRICRRERVWHWLGAFGAEKEGKPCLPQFDCVLGNPPWEKLLLNEREWFAARGSRAGVRGRAGRQAADDDVQKVNEDVQAGNANEQMAVPTIGRQGMPAELAREKRRLAALAHYLHSCSSRLPQDCTGIINLYAPFLWLAVQLCAPRGRVGMVVPTGLMSDRGTLPIFHALHGGGHLRHFYDFENRRLLFPAVDRRQRFACVTLSFEPTEEPARFAFFLHRADELRQAGRVAALDRSVFRCLNPKTCGGVSFRCEADARLALKVHDRLPLLGDAWELELRQGLFNMTADRRVFVPAGARKVGEGVLPLYEGRMLHLFEPRFGGYGEDGAFCESTEEQLADARWMPRARYAVPHGLVMKRLPQEVVQRGWLPVFRMVTSPTNERSFICSIVPVAGVGNSAGLLLPRVDDPRLVLCLVANLSSLVFDYQVRLKLSGNNLNFHIVPQLPVLPPEAYGEADRQYVVQRMLRLLYTWHGLDAMSAACGGPARPYARGSEEVRADLRAELEAWYARRYGLSRSEFAYALDPSLTPELPGNAAGTSTFAILRAREKSCWGEFRTARLSLAAYDVLADSEN